MLWTITLCHCRPDILAHGLAQHRLTTCLTTEHILIDHLYPVDEWKTSAAILELAEKHRKKVLRPYENKGLAGGFNWAMEQLPIAPHDFICGYDPDSHPTTPAWDAAAISAFSRHPSLGAISLNAPRKKVRASEWRALDTEAAVSSRPQFFNVTIWRAKALFELGGLQCNGPAHSVKEEEGLERTMYRLFKEKGWEHGFLVNYIEEECPLQHDGLYHGWKMSTAYGNKSTFRQWARNLDPRQISFPPQKKS